ncbi:ATP synthase F0 subunit B [bacterium]|nr:ATP synthase F0 subunit B [bacterium]
MSAVSHIWNIFVQGNFLNFTLFVLFFAWVFKKIHFGAIAKNLQKSIADKVEVAKKSKDDSVSELRVANKAVENIEAEISEIMSDAKKSAKVISEKIKNEAEKQVLSIEQNAQKVIDAEEKMLIAKLTKKTSKASVEIAKNQIVKALNENPALHEKYINDSIEELDRLNF